MGYDSHGGLMRYRGAQNGKANKIRLINIGSAISAEPMLHLYGTPSGFPLIKL